MPIMNRMSAEEVAVINGDLNGTKDCNHPFRQESEGETFWDILFRGLDVMDSSDTRHLMFSE